MKNILFIFMLTCSSMTQSQITANIISVTEFNNIKINGISFLSIKNTLGNKTEIENLFGTTIAYNIDPDGNYFEYDGFEIGFSSIISDGTYDNPIIGGFDIINSNYNITIQGVTITIGGNINLLGNVVFNTMIDRDKSIIYRYCIGCNNYIYINFNQDTNIITEIGYIEQT